MWVGDGLNLDLVTLSHKYLLVGRVKDQDMIQMFSKVGM